MMNRSGGTGGGGTFWTRGDYNEVRTGRVVGAVVIGVVALLFLIFGLIGVGKAFGRYQSRQDAANRVKVSTIEIRNQRQRVLITKQQAEIRQQKAVGIREAQDKIAKTLTPLYVQFEMTEALKEIARSGRNNSVVYIPAGANGIPLVSTLDPQKVGQPDGG